MRPEDYRPPWAILSGWSIVGMNHYHVNGERRLFVAMTRDGRCIQEEGPDDAYLWNRLWHKAQAINQARSLADALESANCAPWQDQPSEPVRIVDWYCHRCHQMVDPTRVKYDETHEGCGGVCGDPPDSNADRVRKLEAVLGVAKPIVKAWLNLAYRVEDRKPTIDELDALARAVADVEG